MPPRNASFDFENLGRPESPPRAATPPPEPVVPKPTAAKSRSQSAALPSTKNMINGNSSWTTPTRERMDTDCTRHSGTTNTSRHRRGAQYEFSGVSMEQIWQGKPVDDKVILPSYVLCQSQSIVSAGDASGYISALDDSENDFGTSSDNYDGDNDEEIQATSSLQEQQKRRPAAEAKRRETDRPPKASSARPRDQSAKLPPKRPARRSAAVMLPTYLRKSAGWDSEARGKLVVSGWLAASFGVSTFEERFRSESKKCVLGVKDIFYLQIVEKDGKARIYMRSSSGNMEHEIVVQRDWKCETREISSRIGRYVSILSRNSVVNLLPVSLEDAFFSDEKLAQSQQFGKLHDRMFVCGKGKVYAPDEQHDAAMYIMFSLDSLIKNSLF